MYQHQDTIIEAAAQLTMVEKELDQRKQKLALTIIELVGK